MAVEGVFVPNVAVWAKEFEMPGGMVERHIGLIARVTAADAKMTAPRRTGMMRNQIRPRPSGPTEWIVTSGAKYSMFVHEGTRPHPIRPKGPGYPLRFFWPKVGKMVAFWSVRHPGTKPQPFLVESLGRAMRRYTKHTVGSR